MNNEEFNLICSTSFPLLKKGAMEKVRRQLHALGLELQHAYKGSHYKISSGENHHDLPWMVLDFPQIAHAQFPFLLRTFFWWGKGVQYQVFLRKDALPISYEQWLQPWHDSDYLLQRGSEWNNDIFENDYLPAGSVRTENRHEAANMAVWKGVRAIEMKKPEDLFPEAFGFYAYWMAFLSAAQQGS